MGATYTCNNFPDLTTLEIYLGSDARSYFVTFVWSPKQFLNQKLSDEHEKSEKAVQKKGHLTDKNFLNRILYKNTY